MPVASNIAATCCASSWASLLDDGWAGRSELLSVCVAAVAWAYPAFWFGGGRAGSPRVDHTMQMHTPYLPILIYIHVDMK